MKKIIISLVIIAAIIVVGYAGVSYYFSTKLLFPPLLSDEGLKAEYGPIDPSEVGLESESVTFPSRDPIITISGWWIEVPGSDRAVILVHGRNSNKKAMIDYASFFVRQGISCLLIDLRGHGESSPGYATFGDRERDDVLGALDFLAGRGIGPEKKIGCLGLSMGATAAFLAAMDVNREVPSSIDILVFDSGISDVPNSILVNSKKVVGGATPFLLPGALLCSRLVSHADFARANPAAHTNDLTIPILFVMHTLDDTVPFEDQRRLFESYAGPKQSLIFDGLGHHRGFKEKRVEYEKALISFFDLSGF
jgi:alpha-beta hydrolase superfamily lysophospholipase